MQFEWLFPHIKKCGKPAINPITRKGIVRSGISVGFFLSATNARTEPRALSIHRQPRSLLRVAPLDPQGR